MDKNGWIHFQMTFLELWDVESGLLCEVFLDVDLSNVRGLFTVMIFGMVAPVE